MTTIKRTTNRARYRQRRADAVRDYGHIRPAWTYGAFVEWNNSGVGPVELICKRCYEPVPDDFRDEPPRLGTEPPRPPRESFKWPRVAAPCPS